MPNVKSKNYRGEYVTYENVEVLHLAAADSDELVPFSYGEAISGVPVMLDLADGNQTVEAPAGTLVKSAVIQKPETLVAENIRNGITVAGVEGGFIGDTEEATAELAMADGDQVIVPTAEGKVLTKVTIKKPIALIPENIAKDVDIAGVVGTMESGGGTATAQLYAPDITFSKTDKTLTIHFVAKMLQAVIYLDGQQMITVNAPDSTNVASVDLTDILGTYLSCTISVVMKGPNFIDSDPVDIWYMPAYIEIDIGNNSRTNIGTAGTAYNAYFTDKNGSYNDGRFAGGRYFIDGSGGLTIPTDFMAGTDPWTVAFAIDTYAVSSYQYSRFGRGTNDVPSIFYGRSAKAIMFKLTSTTVFSTQTAWYDETSVKPWDGSTGALSVEIPSIKKTVIAFRNDGEYISLWINGEKKVTQAASKYTSTYRASTFTVGNDANNTYNMASMVCSMLKAWNRALTDEEMVKIDR